MIDLQALLKKDVSRETMEKLARLSRLIAAENERQNLVASSTVEDMWGRHIVDSAQLMRFGPDLGPWLDIGSGAGLPGLVIAILRSGPVTLVEPRRLRADFLTRATLDLQLANVTVKSCKVEACRGLFDVISARAVARLGDLFTMAHHLSHPETCWIMPKGRSSAIELAEARRSWQGRFRVEPSVTAEDAAIIVGSGVVARHKGRE